MAKKKTLLIVPIVLALTIIVSAFSPILASANDEGYEPRLTAPNSSIAYYSSKLNRYFQTGTPMPNCVAYAYGRIYEMNGEAPLIDHGSAGDWYSINKNGGYYDYGQEPQLGAVACWSNHVAIVEKINEDGSVTVSESHWGGTYFDVKTFSDMHSHYGQTFYGYIYAYNGGVTSELEKKLLDTEPKANAFKQEATSLEDASEFSIAHLNTEVRNQSAKEAFFNRTFN